MTLTILNSWDEMKIEKLCSFRQIRSIVIRAYVYVVAK